MGSYNCCKASSKESIQIHSLIHTLKIVAEESRLKLLCILNNGEHCVCEIEEHVNMSQSLISHHLRDLKDGGFITSEKRGLKVFYSLTDAGRNIVTTLFSISEMEVNAT